jgi:hypothetical protein
MFFMFVAFVFLYYICTSIFERPTPRGTYQPYPTYPARPPQQNYN